ncbi:MAG: hypothetical protein AAGC60_06970 [Acidobacteriota bacterium]
MLRVCRSCDPATYTLKLLCPKCGEPTVKPYGSTSTYQRRSGKSFAELAERYPPTDRRLVRQVPPEESDYGLIHTLGRTRMDPLGGDGAYARWMQDHFSCAASSRGGCLAARQLVHLGSVGNISNDRLAAEFNPDFLESFRAFVTSPDFQRCSTIIVNWHIRFTNGTPNGWTGRGINAELVKAMREYCWSRGKSFAIIYTIHEPSNLIGRLFEPSALVSLNPDVQDRMVHDFRGPSQYQSKVPGLMRSVHTTAIDRVMQMVGQYLRSVDMESPSSRLFFAGFQQYIRLSAPVLRDSQRLQGIVIFGMIMPRHGLSVAVVTRLACAMDDAGLHADLKVVIAGKESDATLVHGLRNLAGRNARVHFHGQLDGFEDLSHCRYAISFDALGYRDNASAMVNVLREGLLLFSRRGVERDADLIDRAVRMMTLCEGNPRFLLEMLALQQPRYRNTSPEATGVNLDLFFRRVASGVQQIEM